MRPSHTYVLDSLNWLPRVRRFPCFIRDRKPSGSTDGGFLVAQGNATLGLGLRPSNGCSPSFRFTPGRVATHDQLLLRVWGGGHSGDARLVRAVVKRLRRKLGDDAGSPTYIFTEPHVGYRLGQPEESEEPGQATP